MSDAVRQLELITSSNSITVASARIQSALNLISNLLQENDLNGINEILTFLLGSDSSGSLLCRPVVKHIVQEAPQQLPTTTLNKLWEHLLIKLRGRAGAYEEEEIIIREHYATTLEASNKFEDAASCLEILETPEPLMPEDVQRLKRIGRIMDLYLRANNIPAAEVQSNRLCGVIDMVDHSLPLYLELQALQAELLCRTMSCLKAAQKYLELSKCSVAESQQRLTFFKRAVGCLFFAPAGPARTHVVAAIVKDKRLAYIEHNALVFHLFNGRLLHMENVLELIHKNLGDEFLLTLSDGISTLRQALIDHNILAISELFKSISYENLADLLSTTPEYAEKATAAMIRQNRLKNGVLDGESRHLRFSIHANAIKEANARIGEIFSRLDNVVASNI